jgi:hypothetical protein
VETRAPVPGETISQGRRGLRSHEVGEEAGNLRRVGGSLETRRRSHTSRLRRPGVRGFGPELQGQGSRGAAGRRCGPVSKGTGSRRVGRVVRASGREGLTRSEGCKVLGAATYPAAGGCVVFESRGSGGFENPRCERWCSEEAESQESRDGRGGE